MSSGKVVDTKVEDKTFPVKLKDLAGNVTRIKVSGGLTKNMGNFESLRVDVSMEMPCPATPDGIDKAYKYCSTWVPKRIAEMVQGYCREGK